MIQQSPNLVKHFRTNRSGLINKILTSGEVDRGGFMSYTKLFVMDGVSDLRLITKRDKRGVIT